MADGSRQQGFSFDHRPLVSALQLGEIVVDFFAVGGVPCVGVARIAQLGGGA